MFNATTTTDFFIVGFGWPGPPEMLIIGVIFLLLFGGAKLPGLMRNLGRSVNEFKAGIKDPVGDNNLSDESEHDDAPTS